MSCLAANARARETSRAATAATTTSLFVLAGLMSAGGAIRAAPSTPICTGSGYLAAQNFDGRLTSNVKPGDLELHRIEQTPSSECAAGRNAFFSATSLELLMSHAGWTPTVAP